MRSISIVPAVLIAFGCGAPAEDRTKVPKALREQIELAEKKAKDKPDDADAHGRLGDLYLDADEPAKAIAAFTAAIDLEPKGVERLRDRRGDAYLFAGEFKKSVEDYDAYLKAQPDFKPKHWRRGIALYYAGEHKLGVEQFDLHKEPNPEDVENAAWHYLCNVKVVGKEKSQAALIAVTRDPRIPMAQIQKLYAGKLEVKDVLDAAEKTDAKTGLGVSARFYANLYVALWYEADGDAKKAKEHMTAAVETYPVTDYMWKVGRAHLELMKAKK